MSIGIHARFFCELREVNGHSGRALMPEKRQWLSCVGVLPCPTLHFTRQPMFATVSPNSHTVHRHMGPP